MPNPGFWSRRRWRMFRLYPIAFAVALLLALAGFLVAATQFPLLTEDPAASPSPAPFARDDRGLVEREPGGFDPRPIPDTTRDELISRGVERFPAEGPARLTARSLDLSSASGASAAQR